MLLEQVTIRKDNDITCFILGQYAELKFYCVNSQKQQLADTYITPRALYHVVLASSQPVFSLAPWCCVLTGKAKNALSGLTRTWTEHTIFWTPILFLRLKYCLNNDLFFTWSRLFGVGCVIGHKRHFQHYLGYVVVFSLLVRKTREINKTPTLMDNVLSISQHQEGESHTNNIWDRHYWEIKGRFKM